MARPTCPACGARRARRACPALGQQICAVCCGTKRQVEIDCPPDCGYLRSAQAHPPAVVQRRQERDQRQQDRDLDFLGQRLGALGEGARQIAILLQLALRTGAGKPPPLSDADVEQAATAAAQTFETASRGIVYEHRAASLRAQQLAQDFAALIEERRKEGLRLPDADVAAALRCIGKAAHDAERELGGGERAYLELVERFLRPTEEPAATDDAPRIVAP